MISARNVGHEHAKNDAETTARSLGTDAAHSKERLYSEIKDEGEKKLSVEEPERKWVRGDLERQHQ